MTKSDTPTPAKSAGQAALRRERDAAATPPSARWPAGRASPGCQESA